MNPISLGLDGLLVALLLTALVVGVRLNGRLKALRDSQAHFVKAVADLDVAAQRAETGLASLRAATEDTHDQLLARIETARGLVAKLERASLDAERALAKAPPSQPVSGRALAAVSALAPSRGGERASERGPDRGFERGAGLRDEPRPAATRAPPRGRSTFDDDLFESDAPLGPLRRKDDRR